MLQNRKGFTLIELLIVVVIIGILAAIAIPRFSQTRERAYYSAMQSDLRNLMTQQELYFSTKYAYAGSAEANNPASELGFTASDAVTVTITENSDEGETPGWAAEATHSALGADKGCAVFVGAVGDKPSAGNEDLEDEHENRVVCDNDSEFVN